MITAIDPSKLSREAREVETSGTKSDTFALLMASSAPTSGAALSVAGQDKSAAVTSAAVSGVAGASSTNGYMTPFGGPGVIPPGGVSVPGGSGVLPPGTNASLLGGGSGDLSYLQNIDIIGRMRDTNMQMLVLQTDVQNVSREFTVLSNVVKSKFDTEMTAARNIRVS
ncbi:MAG: hypothetical protein Q7S98_03565 [Deltaproteobacteria bacterium]|nr:hypothetical protein [Deltaproteobacteria bacterium]